MLQLPNKAQSGNALILSCYSDSGTGTITIGDDSNANTWTAGPTNTGVHTKKLSQWYAPNVSSSTRIIAASPATSTANWLCAAYEFNNISTSSPGDGNSGNHGTSATYTAGSFTPTTANDLIQTNCFEEGVFGSNNNTTSWTSGGTQGTVTWSLNGADIWQVMGAQWGQQGTAAAINPQMTASLSSDFICVAQALKTATAGGTASGLRVVGMQHTDSANFTACTLNSSCTVTIQMPTSGNALPIAYEGTTAMSLSAVSSTPSNTWVLPAGCLVQISNGAQWVYAVNASTSNTQTFSITQAFYGGAETIIIFDIAGAATSAFDQCITDHATPANHNDITPASLTPAIAGEWMGAVIGVQGGTVVSLTSPAANQNFLSTTFRGEFGLNVPTDRNNGFGGYLIPGTSATSFTWHAGDTTNWAGWASSQIAIKPPSGTTTPQMLDLGVGQ